MILTVDMGNTNIKIGVVDEKTESVIEERVATSYDKTSLEYANDIHAAMRFHGLTGGGVSGAIVSSVVPPLTGVMVSAIRKAVGADPLVVTNELKMGISLRKFQYPSYVGADLIVGAEAALNYYPLPCIVVNMGTATTITVINDKGEFMGGSIMPGMKISANSLSANTSTLPEVNLANPGRAISRDTAKCMTGGIVYGTAGGIDAVIDRCEEELGAKCACVATGGMARFAIPYCRHDITIDNVLMMKGLLSLYRQNAGEQRNA